MPRLPWVRLAALVVLAGAACATQAPPPAAPTHGTLPALPPPTADVAFCEHDNPADQCTRCHPDLEAAFRARGDFCGEHGVPESQCRICHPDLPSRKAPAARAPEGADVARIADAGQDVPSLAAHAVAGKVTVFDFYADWCAPCREVDAHMYQVLARRPDVAYRKLNVVSWESPLAKRYMKDVPTLPYVIVYGRDGQKVEAISGLDLAKLDGAIERGAR